MRKTLKVAIPILLIIGAAIATGLYLHGHSIPVLQPHGQIGQKELNLIIFGLILSAIVVLPTFFLLFFIAWRYRESNTKAKHTPDWDHSKKLEFLWWSVPCVIILMLSIVAWTSSHSLDPYKSLASSKKPLTIQVVSLDWKWLFIYPEQHIASVNYVQFPVGAPVDFKVTSDTVMNSFWVPSLGGQIYAMPGMSTQIHWMTDKVGDYHGSAANITGDGFSGMTFTAHASSQQGFDRWVQRAQDAQKPLNASTYAQLAKPSKNNPVTYYSSVEHKLYDTIVMKYMMPTDTHNTSSTDKTQEQPSTTTQPSTNMQNMDMQNMEGMEM